MLKNKINLLVFDLDGTLMDAGKTIFLCTKHSLNEMKIENDFLWEDFVGLIGEHFEIIFDKFKLKVDFEPFIKIYKKNYFNFIQHTTIYPGIIEMLEFLKKEKLYTAILTTKAQDQLDLILSHFNLNHYFDFPLGRRDGLGIKPDPQPLLFICENLNIPVQNTLFVGDTDVDIICGKSAGTLTCAVTYGYRNKDLLKEYNPDFILDSLTELKTLLIH